MRYLVASCCAVVLVACSKPEQQQAKDTMADSAATTAAAPTPPPPPTIALADLAGKWEMTTMNEKGDSTLLKYQMVATADSTGWEIHFPKRKPVPVHVTASGDSIILDAGPFESALRKGLKVTTHGVSRLKDGKLVGTTVAHYDTKRADSVLTLKVEGTRAK